MKLLVASAILAFTASSVADPLYECDGRYNPDYDTCDKIVADWEGNSDYINNDGMAHCLVYGRSEGGNCLAHVCFYSEADLGASKTILYAWYDGILKRWCKDKNLGGRVSGNDDTYSLAVWNNPDFTGSRMAAPADMRDFAISQKTNENGITETKLSLDDFNKLFNATEAAEPKVKSRRALRKEAIAARQEEDDDFDMLYIEKSVAKDGERFQASNKLSSGAEETWSFSETKSVSVSTTAGVSAGLWDIFSVSAEITTTQENSETVQSGMTFKVGTCPDSAIVYWVPLWDHYVGYWSSDPDTEWHAWIPTAKDDYAAGEWQTECLG
ncbi:hypothetical protein LIA77_04040 [Sarocladium implicatum]|nr:hypothetical protein LIA77_04040 [Sarocladium implicatum]